MVFPHSFRSHRLLVVAPHPDDESLATGGLIQRVIKDGGDVRVIFVSDGENNPWPQRVLERRWTIGRRERARWGDRRRTEALAALRQLGVPSECAEFLGLPDQGMTAMLLRGDETPIVALRKELEASRPTLLASPSPHDLHPDHNALSVLLNAVASRLPAGPPLRHFHYIVHGRAGHFPRPCWTLHLSAEERLAKYQAILEHRTQMVLSRKRFLAYARGCEHFHPAGATSPVHRVRHAGIENGALCVWLQPAPGFETARELWVAVESVDQGSLRWRIPIRRHGGLVRVQDAITGQALRNLSIRHVPGLIQIRMPISASLPVRHIALKLHHSTLFYDAAGWSEVPLPAQRLFSCSAIPSPVTPFFSSSFVPSSFGGVSEVSA